MGLLSSMSCCPACLVVQHVLTQDGLHIWKVAWQCREKEMKCVVMISKRAEDLAEKHNRSQGFHQMEEKLGMDIRRISIRWCIIS